MKILILANHYNTLRIFRRELLIRLRELGHEVVVSIPPCDDENRDTLCSYGCRVIFTKEMERRGMNPLKDLALLRAYRKLLRQEKPEKVITYTIKCNIYGAYACKAAKIPCYANVTGLGSTFQGRGMMRKLVSAMYKFSMNRCEKILFENVGNRDTLVNDGIVRTEQTVVMPGAGVNLDEFPATPYPESQSPLIFLFVGRIMQEKGVDEYFEAIQKIKAAYPDTEFHFIGWYEDHYEETVKALEKQGLIHFHGFQLNVKPFIEKAHCIVHPSWHEGMSNTLLEASAMCRPIITTRIHGCMEAVEEGRNGYLCEKKSAASICEAITRFLNLPYVQKAEMGIAGRQRMLEQFDKHTVVDKTVAVIFNQ